jgi:High potential iron-sulfur protein
MNRERRVFMLVVGAIGATAAAPLARAQTHLDEKDPQAAALGYVEDTARADQNKFPNHAATQNCAGCALGQFKTGESYANCTLFAGKQVNAKGWCSAFVKRAA